MWYPAKQRPTDRPTNHLSDQADVYSMQTLCILNCVLAHLRALDDVVTCRHSLTTSSSSSLVVVGIPHGPHKCVCSLLASLLHDNNCVHLYRGLPTHHSLAAFYAAQVDINVEHVCNHFALSSSLRRHSWCVRLISVNRTDPGALRDVPTRLTSAQVLLCLHSAACSGYVLLRTRAYCTYTTDAM